jgi:alpha-beta hydrolase superfamily lysophospholipase
MGKVQSQALEEVAVYTQPIKGVTFSEKIIELNGRKINVSRWTPERAPKAVVIVSHGLHEHGLRYYSVANALASMSYLVIALDHSSHGLSEGTRGLITDFRYLPMDFVSLCKNTHEEFPALPCFIVSHSMGTLVSIMSIKELPFVKVRK